MTSDAIQGRAAPARSHGGRPRQPATDAAIMRATLEVLQREGYQALTMQAVAGAAGVGKPTLYRRFAGKADLVAAALLHLTAGPEPALPVDTRAALRVLLGSAATALARPGAMVIVGSLSAARSADPRLMHVLDEQVFAPRRAQVRGVLHRGVAAGEIDARADLQVIDDMLFGAVLARAMLGSPITDYELDTIVAFVVRGAAPGAGNAA